MSGRGANSLGRDSAGASTNFQFCWNTGHWSYFMADGSFTSDRREYFKKRPGHWRAPSRASLRSDIPSARRRFSRMVRFTNIGAFAHSKEKGAKSHDKDLWGTVCN